MISAPERVLQSIENTGNEVLTRTFADENPLNILIADDNFVNQKLMERILSRLGYQTDAVSDGSEVLNSLNKKKYNVILMDVRMPEMDGLETTQAIRQMRVNQPYIIALTANGMPTDREDCLKAGMNEYILKPICVEEVMTKLKIAADFCSTNK